MRHRGHNLLPTFVCFIMYWRQSDRELVCRVVSRGHPQMWITAMASMTMMIGEKQGSLILIVAEFYTHLAPRAQRQWFQ